jgi:chromosome segregation ATPase
VIPSTPDEATATADAAVADNLEVITATQRVLASRIAELEAELTRQSAVAERLRQRLAEVMDEDLAATDEVDALHARIDELTAQLDAARARAQERGAALDAIRGSRPYRWARRPVQLARQLAARIRPGR